MRLALILAAALIVAPPAMARQAAPSPDFSGHWVLVSVSPARSGYESFWFGVEAIVTHTATTVEIQRLRPEPARKATFLLNGPESQNTFTVNGRREIKDSRATFGKGLLLISTETTTDDERRWLSNILRWSLHPSGDLVVGDTEICGSGECPSVVTTLTFRRQ